mgnify:CR=1 FL=1
MEIAFWILLFIVFYTYAGYALVLAVILYIKKRFSLVLPVVFPEYEELPRVCMFMAAYNEHEYAEAKIANLLALDYPKDKIQYLWITDGSDDGTPDFIRRYPQMEVHHLPERRGKIHAMNRGMQFVDAPIVIFSDSNTMICKEAVRIIVNTFRDKQVGCIAGEKRIESQKADAAAGSGENIYWKFESWVKRMDSELNSTVGAVGELFAIRTNLFAEVENDTILDDFVISMRIAEKGYHIAYTPDAYAIESPSINVSEELKRKVRIAAGAIQTIGRLKELLNPLKYGWLSVQYISHKVLRWTIAPVALFLVFLINFFMVMLPDHYSPDNFYAAFFYFQLFMYFLALLGWFFEGRKMKFKPFFVPFYFVAMNYASVLGMIRFWKGKQSVNWEKSKRA